MYVTFTAILTQNDDLGNDQNVCLVKEMMCCFVLCRGKNKIMSKFITKTADKLHKTNIIIVLPLILLIFVVEYFL